MSDRGDRDMARRDGDDGDAALEERLRERARRVLAASRRAGTSPWEGRQYDYTCPSPRSYPFQWFWDSCFHAIALTHLDVALALDEPASRVVIRATARTVGKTGVEMEALTAVSVAALTIYDMAKAVDRGMRIENVRLLEKHGGKSGDYVAEDKESIDL